MNLSRVKRSSKPRQPHEREVGRQDGSNYFAYVCARLCAVWEIKLTFYEQLQYNRSAAINIAKVQGTIDVGAYASLLGTLLSCAMG